MYGIPRDDLSLSERRNYRASAQEKAIQKALGLAYATAREDLVVSGIYPHTHLGNPAGSGYTNERFITGIIPANTWTSVYDTGNVAQVPTRTVLVIYKIVNMTAAPNIRGVRFRLGATGTTTLGWVQVDIDINVQLTPEIYLTEPIVYTGQQWADIQCYASPAVAVGEELGFIGYAVEPVGETQS